MLDNVRIDDNTINFELALGSSTWRFQVGRDVIDMLAHYNAEDASEELDVDSVAEDFLDLFENIAVDLIGKGAPTDCPVVITVENLP